MSHVPVKIAMEAGTLGTPLDPRQWTPDAREAERRQLSRLLLAGFLILLVPATLGWATGWRWRPWPPGPQGYGSAVSEAREAARSFVPLAFSGL